MAERQSTSHRYQQGTLIAIGAGLGATVGGLIGGGPGIGIGLALGAGFGVAADAMMFAPPLNQPPLRQVPEERTLTPRLSASAPASDAKATTRSPTKTERTDPDRGRDDGPTQGEQRLVAGGLEIVSCGTSEHDWTRSGVPEMPMGEARERKHNALSAISIATTIITVPSGV